MDTMKALSGVPFTKVAPFGSRVVGCATDKSDYDYLILVRERPTTDDMADTGFKPDVDDPLYGKDFSSWRSDNVNLVFTDSESYFDATIEACEFCRKYKVYDKADRCKVHEYFRDAVKYNKGVPDVKCNTSLLDIHDIPF